MRRVKGVRGTTIAYKVTLQSEGTKLTTPPSCPSMVQVSNTHRLPVALHGHSHYFTNKVCRRESRCQSRASTNFTLKPDVDATALNDYNSRTGRHSDIK